MLRTPPNFLPSESRLSPSKTHRHAGVRRRTQWQASTNRTLNRTKAEPNLNSTDARVMSKKMGKKENRAPERDGS